MFEDAHRVRRYRVGRIDAPPDAADPPNRLPRENAAAQTLVDVFDAQCLGQRSSFESRNAMYSGVAWCAVP